MELLHPTIWSGRAGVEDGREATKLDGFREAAYAGRSLDLTATPLMSASVGEGRKREKPAFAGRPHLNINTPQAFL
ncbi:hypothetical protein, partial [Mesorhizobium sp. M1E.F.Ca.ET.063.01.1.1]|uniref:hypothetical protein n=1 Tax=Mesorhizobium sp. M1E.F.Ca.ET.063.01.1.1 TaxID=2496750 RepID=UPI001AECC45F